MCVKGQYAEKAWEDFASDCTNASAYRRSLVENRPWFQAWSVYPTLPPNPPLQAPGHMTSGATRLRKKQVIVIAAASAGIQSDTLPHRHIPNKCRKFHDRRQRAAQ